jgi:hypothetical protein
MNLRISAAPASWRERGAMNSNRRGALAALDLRLLLVLLAIELAAGPAFGQRKQVPVQDPDPCIAGQSCFTNVTDILNGQRHLLRVDDLVIAGQFGNAYAGAILNTSNSAITASRASSLAGNIGLPGDLCPEGVFTTTVSARMFNLNHDVTLSAACVPQAFPYQLSVYVDPDPSLPKGLPISTSFGAGFVPSGFQLLSTAADFTGDGYDDVVYVGLTANTGGNILPDAIVLSAVDPTMPSRGLRAGNPSGFDFPSVTPLSVAAGDFTGGGHPTIAILGIPSQGNQGNPGGLGIQFYSVDASSLQIGLPNDGLGDLFIINIPEGPGYIASAALVAGRFGNTAHEQLALIYAVPGGTAKIITIDFDPQGNPIQKATLDTGIQVTDSPRVVMRAGHFDWSGAFDQAAVLIATGASGNAGSRVEILGFDTSLNPVAGPPLSTAGACQFDMVAGNFDRMQANPHPPPATERDPNLQLALLASDCGSNISVALFNVDPTNNFAVSAAGTSTLPAQLVPGAMRNGSLVASDSQGRSLALGLPVKVVITKRSQPSVVLAAPPMHVDYITPARASMPQVFNVSAIPNGFFTQYQTDQSNSTQSSTQNTTSWSAGASETLQNKGVFGIPDVDTITVQNKFSAQQAWKGNTQSVHGTTSSTQFDVSQQTGFGDQLWYEESRLNLYIYPVIGQTGCPAEIPNCSDSQKVPLTVQFSGVDAVSNDTVPGNTTEWYQPPWEAGNVLSYPGNFAQLQAFEPNLDQISTDLTWVTDQSVFLEKTTWNTGTSDSKSTSFDQNYSFSDTFSVSGYTDDIFVQSSFKASLSLSGSFGFSNLHTAVTTLGKSTGIGVQKPGSFASPPDYQYFVTPYIFGQKRPGGVVNDIPLSTDVQTFGVLQTAFVVDPVRADAGGWWKQAYNQAPDVALNHPTRWTIRLSNRTNPNDGTCLQINTSTFDIDCAALAPSDPSNPWLSEFHSMRGLFITGAEAGGKGPQLETATAGDLLLLQARVHNFSLASMPQGTTVRTRFYGVPWNNNNNAPNGPSFLIGEAVTGAIPPFNTDTGSPNWQLVSIPTPFDTTPYADQYLSFWVIVWMEDANGRLSVELPGHGLMTIPGTLTSFSDVAAFEQPYSNNVGFYRSAFYVFPKITPPIAMPRSGPVFKMAAPFLSADHIARGQPVRVDAFLAVGDAPLRSGVTLRFYDGDPATGGKAFDLERIAYLRARDFYRVAVPFRSNQCGQHRLFVAAEKGTAFETIRGSLPVTVDCP